MELSEEPVASPQDLDAMFTRADPARDAVLLLPDPVLRSNAMLKVALVGAYKRRLALIAYSEGLVMAGALMAVHSTVPLLAADVGAIIADFRVHGQLRLRYYPQRFEISVNYQLAKSLGISIPSEAILANKIEGGRHGR
jgi:ABC-type uncharacterized transport system substrate-binding protein